MRQALTIGDVFGGKFWDKIIFINIVTNSRFLTPIYENAWKVCANQKEAP